MLRFIESAMFSSFLSCASLERRNMGRNMDKVICQDDSFLSCLILAPLNSGKGESALNACHIWRDAVRCLHISFLSSLRILDFYPFIGMDLLKRCMLR